MQDLKIYKFFADYIYKNSGILYEENDFYRLESRLNAMVKHFKVENVDQVYQMYLQKVTPEMHTFLVDLATNNETYFMRDMKPFKALVADIVPGILKEKNPLTLNIWSAGCSTGQETYSILMSIKDQCGDLAFNRINIDATDISTEALDKAKSGTYDGLEVQRGLPIATLMKHFAQNEDETWTINSEFKRKIAFKQLNLLTEVFPSQKYHIIFCRNVLIYQDAENKKKILEKLFRALQPGGFLLLGSGESLIGMKLDCTPVKFQEAMFYQKAS